VFPPWQCRAGWDGLNLRGGGQRGSGLGGEERNGGTRIRRKEGERREGGNDEREWMEER